MASRKKAPRAKNKSLKISKILSGVGIGLLLLASYILYQLFKDPIAHELRYVIHATSKTEIKPVDTDFGLVIDKLGISVKVIPNVDPYDSRKYQQALAQGIAHAKGTKVPGQGGNIFLFAHSSADLLTAERYNSVLYLMHHLQTGDSITVWKDGSQHDYVVFDKKIVASTETNYLSAQSTDEQLTLMTCWPPGTNMKRLIVIAKKP